MEVQSNTMRGQLVEVVAKHVVPFELWEDISTLSPALQAACDENINFTVQVSDAQRRGDRFICCEIHFTTEQGKPAVISVTVESKQQVENEQTSN